MTPRQVLIATIALVAGPRAAASAEPFYAVSDDTLIVRAAANAAWIDGGTERTLKPAVQVGTLVNKSQLAADLDISATFADPRVVTGLVSAGAKLKFLSTPENMGFTYVYAGIRAAFVDDVQVWAPGIGARDFITYDIVPKTWAFTFEWHALFSVPTQTGFDDWTLDGGAAVGIAYREETPSNFALIAGWRRQRVREDTLSILSDAAVVGFAHQWR